MLQGQRTRTCAKTSGFDAKARVNVLPVELFPSPVTPTKTTVCRWKPSSCHQSTVQRCHRKFIAARSARRLAASGFSIPLPIMAAVFVSFPPTVKSWDCIPNIKCAYLWVSVRLCSVFVYLVVTVSVVMFFVHLHHLPVKTKSGFHRRLLHANANLLTHRLEHVEPKWMRADQETKTMLHSQVGALNAKSTKCNK